MNEPVLKFLQELPAFGKTDIERALNMFHEYNDILIQWNKTMNLMSENDIPKIWSRHFLDSIIAAPYIDFQSKIIDIGSGAGLPGIPLKILYPSINLTLLDSNQKCCQFLNQLIKELKLSQINVICDRSEATAKNTMKREAFDFAITRAFAKPEPALEMVIPFIKFGGRAIFWGSPDNWSNISALNKIAALLGGEYLEHKDYTLPSDIKNTMRRLTVVKKISKTPEGYPRAVGIPQKRPLK